MPGKTSTLTRKAILEAANHIVLEQGVDRLTLEAAAAAAGVSKGGLLYHFPNKEALIVGMIQSYLERFTTDFNFSAEKDPPAAAGRWTRAYLETTFADNERIPRLSSGLLAAIATDPSLLTPLQQTFADWVGHLSQDGIDPVTATIIRLAADGVWLVELFGLNTPDAVMKARVMETLLEMSRTPAK